MVSKISEENIHITVPEGVFYNPEMEFCRDICSLAVGAIGSKVSLLDAMCASGVRGMRYKKENKNVAKLTLLDLSSKAVSCARKNAKANKVKCGCVKADARIFMHKNEFDFVELDPFGSPVPFLNDACRSFRTKKRGYLSVTATDMAVLCGAHHAACLKNYGAAPLDNEFCHENAARILIGKTILAAAPENLSAKPVFTLSHLHYVKVIFEVSQGAKEAVESVKKTGFVSYCPACCYRENARLPRKQACPHCGHQLEHAGPLYLGELWDAELLGKMLKLNVLRSYRKKKEIGKTLSTQLSESRIPSYGYYDLHTLAKKRKTAIMSIDGALEAIRKAGFAAARTHFCPTAVRTGAPHEAVLKALGK